MDNNFGGVIWTNHAIERMREREIKQGDAWATWRNPDQSRKGSAKDTWIYYKTYDQFRIEVVAKKNERGEWIILSVWSKMVNDNSYKKENNPPLFQLIWNKIFSKGNNKSIK